MMERIPAVQNFESVEVSDLISKVADFKAEGYRLVQICGVNLDDDTYEILYSFDKDHVLTNLRLDIAIGTEVESITGIYWAAFVYENEVHDLFGVKFNHSALDYQGTFFKISEETPWKPKK
ncbi:MAG: NADH-quinone oxidoreductase subunit C [Eubacteriales bacterium]|nr:NADH-quinone oxidoreductase subunit C [Eubacteriales bacterium]